jgi:carboxypeptidase family protein/TonB-dependent receptor-like protein
MRALPIACCCACCAVAIPLTSPLAQNSDRKSRILGVVGDSVNEAPLRNAEVIVSGLAPTFSTDSFGRFTIDSVPPGRYQIGVFHPVLESLGITLATSPFVVGPDSAAIVNLSVPSVTTLVRRYCGAKQTPSTPSSFAGLVLDPENDAPIAGAKVSLAWTQITVSKQSGVMRTPHELHTETNSSGFFKLCALPSDLDGTLQVTQGNASTPEVPVTMRGALLAFQTMSLRSKAEALATGVVTGHVFLEDGQPVAGARVQIPVSGVSVVTREDGAFRLTGVQTGTQVLIAMNLGFATAAGPINVTSREPTDVVVTLAPKVNVLDPVLITARRDVALEKAGFNSRKRTQHGYFITREDIDRRKPNNISDMLRNIPGVTVSYQRGGVVISGRSAVRTTCTSVIIDGFEWRGMQAGDLDMVVNPDDVIGLEVYEEYDAPAQYNRYDRGCLTLMIWRQVRSKVKN